MENKNAYEKPITLKNILKFAVPTIAMKVFMSFYTMVDDLFVSNLIGTDALSAINLTAPVIQLVTAVSTMLATGGSAVIMKKMGEQKTEEAKQDFTFLILVNVVVGIVMCGAGYVAMEHIFAGMNLSAAVEGYCVEYLSRYLVFTVPILLMNNFTLYIITSEKATLSLICSVTGGVLNMVLDYVFIAGFFMGISGAAVATGLGYSVTAVAGLFVFSRKKSLLHFTKPVCRFKVLAGAATNGCSEMATALVTGSITMMFNWTMLHYVGEDGGCGRHHHHVCADVCQLPLYGVFIRCGAHAELLLRGTKTEKAGCHESESDRMYLSDHGCRILYADKAAGIGICPAG